MSEHRLEPLIKAAVEKYQPLAVELSDDLYANPELPDQEFRSSAKVVELLRNAGYEVEYPFDGRETAFRGVIGNGSGPSAAILVEYDALPGLGHACGHNASCAMSVLAALALADLKDRFPGTLYAIGTPAEEDNGAKVGMAKRGVFDGMSLAIMAHSWSGGAHVTDMDVLSLQCYLVEFRGLSAHAAASPWSGHNALSAARKFLDLIDARRECFTPDIRVNGIITDGGKAPNILPDRAEVRLEFRTDSQGKLRLMDDIIRKCARGAAIALDCEVSFTEGFEGFDDMVCVPALEQEVKAVLEGMGEVCREKLPPSGSSDVGNASYRCPTVQPLVSLCDPPYALHTGEFRDETVKPAAHRAIATGGRLIASMVCRTLTDPEFRQRVQDSFEASRAAKLEL
ncbi:amidohydrolase [Pseudoflavonifractor phocaeensis]|uniref:amidohydrolase n=1 Tax=Pseudoflavonifractor phocaeensis TaxID=1870988 RepID=UPI001F39D8AE|nr:amidohydrolase [Pseudoflavonifractor phocaeensis]MCF2662798.1 amidohydrolase [Pseudoflavonifractor phocaeensis]